MKKLLFILFLGFGLAAKAQAPDPDTTARHFLIMASIGNLQEVNAGKMAAEKAQNADVKAFGQMMVKDHGEAEQKLLALAKQRNIQLPSAAMDTPPQDLNMKKLSGNDFDRKFLHAMASGHGSTVQMFQNYATTGKDPMVKAFAAQMLPTLKMHLESVKALNEKYKNLVAK